jgi:hypothetical protein
MSKEWLRGYREDKKQGFLIFFFGSILVIVGILNKLIQRQ